MPSYTPNFNMITPFLDDPYSIDDFNNNFTIIDTEIYRNATSITTIEQDIANMNQSITNINNNINNINQQIEIINNTTGDLGANKANKDLSNATNPNARRNIGAYGRLDDINNKDLLAEVRNLYANNGLTGYFMATDCWNTPDSSKNWWLCTIPYAGAEMVLEARSDGICATIHFWGNSWRGDWQFMPAHGAQNVFTGTTIPTYAKNGDWLGYANI